MIHLGWIPFEDRTRELNEAHERIVGEMPTFRITGSVKREVTKKVLLTDFWGHDAVLRALGFKFPRIRQLTGSCVGAGGGVVVFTLGTIEVIRLMDPEQILVPFWLYTYGKSRQRVGIRGRGEGSLGSAFAEAARLDGVPQANLPGLPGYRVDDGLIWSERDEMVWSDGAAAPADIVAAGKKNLVKTTAKMNSADEVREAITNYYPCTDACSGYVGNPRVQGSGDDAVLVGDIDTNGPHQTSILGWQEHPQFGEQFLYQNQWPEQVYPRDPAGGPPCSAWISKRRMDWICKTGEVYAFSQFDGYPAQVIDQSEFKITGK